MINTRHILIVVVSAFSTLFLFSCKNEIADIKAITEDRVVPLQTNIDASYRYTENGRLRNLLEAKQLDQYGGDSTYIVASGGFKMTFYDSLEVETASMSAVRGVYFEKQNKLIAEENVVLVNTQGEMLETSKLIFEQDSSRIYTDQFVTITSGDGKFYGKGLESNGSFTKYRILQPTGDIYVEE